MRIPKGMTEKQILKIIDNVVNILAGSFKFAYFDIEDMKQEGRLEAIKALEDYDETRELAPFLYTHIRNRFLNLHRKIMYRSENPCKKCSHDKEDFESCPKYKSWVNRNTRKKNIAKPLDLFSLNIYENNDESSEERIEIAELLDLIDKKLDVALRAIYLQMRSGETVPINKRKQVEKAVLEIIKCQPKEDS